MGNEPLAEDVVEQGDRRFPLPSWRPSRGAGVLAVAALIVGLAAGYAAGDRHARGSATLPKPAGTASPSMSFTTVPKVSF
ncbi:MAG TPA: hypothetical protein VF482_15405, partial [Trebonia sp.]